MELPHIANSEVRIDLNTVPSSRPCLKTVGFAAPGLLRTEIHNSNARCNRRPKQSLTGDTTVSDHRQTLPFLCLATFSPRACSELVSALRLGPHHSAVWSVQVDPTKVASKSPDSSFASRPNRCGTRRFENQCAKRTVSRQRDQLRAFLHVRKVLNRNSCLACFSDHLSRNPAEPFARWLAV